MEQFESEPRSSSARMDLLGLLDGADARSECSSAVTHVPHDASPCLHPEADNSAGPSAKRARAAYYVTKIGIGVVGVRLDEVQEIFGASYEKMKKKACLLCKKFMLSPDPVQQELSRAWHKPNFEGKVCAYCGVGKCKLWPHRSVADVVFIIGSKPEESERFFKFTSAMILAYQNGDKAAKGLTDAPTESLEKEASTNFDAKVNGKMILRAAYEDEYGDPHTNGKNHCVITTTWKDGSEQEVVLVPQTKETEMECSWGVSTALKHKRILHDGNMTTSANQLKDIYSDMRRTSARPLFQGEVAAPLVASSLASPSSGVKPPASLTASTAGDSAAGREDSSEAEEEEDALLSLIGGGRPAKRKDRAKADASAKAGKAKAKGKADASAPPPLSGGAGGARRGGAKAKAKGLEPAGPVSADKADKDAQAVLQKLTAFVEQFATSQKASLIALDKKFYKTVKLTTDSVEPKMRGATSSTRQKLTATSKQLELVARYVKAYKLWVRKFNSDEFLAEHRALLRFAGEPPEVELEMPTCLQKDILEMKFVNNLDTVLKNGDTKEMTARYTLLCLTACASLDMADALKEWQGELLNNALLRILRPDEETEVLPLVQCFLSPLPLLPATRTDFEMASETKKNFLILRAVFDTKAYPGNTTQVNDWLLEVSKGECNTFRVFSGIPVGRKLLSHLKAAVKDQMAKEQAVERIGAMCIGNDMSMETLGKLDSEFHGVGFVVDDGHKTHFVAILTETVRSAAADTFAVLAEVLDQDLETTKFTFTGLVISTELEGTRSKLSTLRSLKCLQQDDFMTAEVNNLFEIVEFLRVVCSAPLQLLLKNRAGTMEITDLDDLAPLTAALQSICFPTRDMQRLERETMLQMKLDLAVLSKALEKSNSMLESHEEKCVAPRLRTILEALYQDDAYWKEVALVEDEATPAVFVKKGVVDEVADLYQKQRGFLSSVQTSVDDTLILLVALKKSDLAVVLRVHWRLHVSRLMYANLTQHTLSMEVTEIPAGMVAAYTGLSKDLEHLVALIAAKDMQDSFAKFAKRSVTSTMGMKPCTWMQMQKELNTAREACTDALTAVLGWGSARITAMANKLENDIPQYKPFLEDRFDSDTVNAELIQKDWQWFAEEWVKLNSFVHSFKSLPASLIGKFETLHSCAITVSDRALRDGKLFISICSSVKMILVTLPGLPKAQRKIRIEEHLERVKTVNLPKNLSDFFVRELKKTGKQAA